MEQVKGVIIRKRQSEYEISKKQEQISVAGLFFDSVVHMIIRQQKTNGIMSVILGN